jgi:ABC-type transport system involved in cytochrome c biogenesis permease subunit
MKTSRMQKLTVGFIGLLALTLFIRDVRSPDYMEGWDLATFASLPVQEGGRIKPVDTVARTTLMLLGGKQTYRDVDGTRHEAVEWLAELLLNPQAAASRPVFRIDHPELVGLLGYQNEERKYFALAEIAPHFNQLQAEFEGVPQESRLRNAYEAALAKLQNSLALYDRVAYALVPPPFFGDALSTYGMVLRAHADAIAAEPGTETHGTVGNALRLFKSQFSQLAAGTSIQAIPPLSPEDTNGWHTLGSSLLQTADTGQLDPVVNGYAELSLAFAQRDALQFNETLAWLDEALAERAGGSDHKSGFELFFNTFAPFYYSMELYVLILIVAAFSWLGWSRLLARTALVLLVVAFCIHTFGIGARIYIQARPPVTNLYSSAVFVSWAAVPLCLLLEKRYLNGIASAAAALLGFATLIIAHHLSFSGDTMEMMRAVLDSNFWLATHVPTVTIGYSATFLAGFIALIYIIRDRLFGGIPEETGRVVSGMVYGTVCFALLFSFVGTVLGGIWADQSWGRFWGWDPKENGALMIVLWNALILHARWAKIATTTAIMQLAIFGNIITAWSWFGTNMLGVGLHSYGFMDAAFFWLLAFIGSQLFVICLPYLRPRAGAA